MESTEHYRDRLKELRKYYSVRELAGRIGIPRSTIHAMETGKISSISVEAAKKIEDFDNGIPRAIK